MEKQSNNSKSRWRRLIEASTFLLLVAIIATVGVSSAFDYIEELEERIKTQDELIEHINSRDSIVVERTKEAASVITKYVSDCGLSINGRTLSTEEIVKMINDLRRNVSLFDDSLFACRMRALELSGRLSNESKRRELEEIRLQMAKDSIRVLKKILSISEERYGIKYSISERQDDNILIRTITSKFSRADSALCIFPYYHDRLYYDSTKAQWIIKLDRSARRGR